MTYIFI